MTIISFNVFLSVSIISEEVIKNPPPDVIVIQNTSESDDNSNLLEKIRRAESKLLSNDELKNGTKLQDPKISITDAFQFSLNRGFVNREMNALLKTIRENHQFKGSNFNSSIKTKSSMRSSSTSSLNPNAFKRHPGKKTFYKIDFETKKILMDKLQEQFPGLTENIDSQDLIELGDKIYVNPNKPNYIIKSFEPNNGVKMKLVARNQVKEEKRGQESPSKFESVDLYKRPKVQMSMKYYKNMVAKQNFDAVDNHTFKINDTNRGSPTSTAKETNKTPSKIKSNNLPKIPILRLPLEYFEDIETENEAIKSLGERATSKNGKLAIDNHLLLKELLDSKDLDKFYKTTARKLNNDSPNKESTLITHSPRKSYTSMRSIISEFPGYKTQRIERSPSLKESMKRKNGLLIQLKPPVRTRTNPKTFYGNFG